MKNIDYHPENCKIYTPEDISDMMIKELDIKWDEDIKILEPAVGTGNIFIPLLKIFLEHFKNSSIAYISNKMRNTFWVFDIDPQSLNKLISEIIITCKSYGFEYNNEVNIENMNILNQELDNKYDYIIGNPPYITKRRLTKEQREAMRNSNTCSKYNYDMYFYFFEKSIDLLNENGTLVFITPNAYLNSISGLELRKEIINNTSLEKIINFPNQNLFNDALVKVCITKLIKKEREKEHYKYLELDNDKYLSKKELKINVNNFLIDKKKQHVDIGEKLEDLFYISGGIATLNDRFFIIKDYEVAREDRKYIFIEKEEEIYKIEKELIKKIIRPRREKVEDKIIFPYTKDNQKIEEEEIKKKYPGYYKYFKECSLAKGLYYGRSQGLKYLSEEKIVFPKISSSLKPYDSINELVVSGIYFVPLNERAKKMIPRIKEKHSKILEEIKFECKNHGSSTYTINTTVLKKLSIDLVN